MTDEKTNAVELAKTDLRAACDMVIERSAAMMVEELGAPIEMMLDRMLTDAGPSMCATGKPSRGDSTGDHTGREAPSGQSADHPEEFPQERNCCHAHDCAARAPVRRLGRRHRRLRQRVRRNVTPMEKVHPSISLWLTRGRSQSSQDCRPPDPRHRQQTTAFPECVCRILGRATSWSATGTFANAKY
ncbi:hypothetical protein [Mesorhizobium sp. AaZ16]|uniref:hypothetical protein n=1 Tax=Mesorhizobium sp. AaZ16 TaxID=3402289 RepID=UPI00374EAAFF